MDERQVQFALARLRVELFTAAQTLKGDDLATLRELVRDIAQVLDFDVMDERPAPRDRGDHL